MSDAWQPGISAAARAVMASRCSPAGVCAARCLWGGMAAGMSSVTSGRSACTAVRTERIWPRWGGLKLPP